MQTQPTKSVPIAQSVQATQPQPVVAPSVPKQPSPSFLSKIFAKKSSQVQSSPEVKKTLATKHADQEKSVLEIFEVFRIQSEKEYLIENLCMLLDSGMTILSSLNSIKADMTSHYMHRILERAQEEIEGGSPLWKALKNTTLFSDGIIALVRVGEESGRLSENLGIISQHQQKESDFKSKLSSALMYPVFVFGITLVVGIGVAWFILPRLATVFSQLRIKLPFITKILIGMGQFLGAYGVIVMPILILAIISVLYILFFNSKTKYIGQKMLFYIPAIRKIIQEVELARMGFILGNLLNAGLTAAMAFESLGRSTDFYAYKEFYTFLHEKILEGNSVQKTMGMYAKVSHIMPIPIQQLIIAGEQSGKLANSLIRVGEIFEAKSDTSMKNLPIVLEPVLLVIVWLGVVAVAIAVILPLYSLIGGLNSAK
jgi:type II secretory pathway component PulF